MIISHDNNTCFVLEEDEEEEGEPPEAKKIRLDEEDREDLLSKIYKCNIGYRKGGGVLVLMCGSVVKINASAFFYKYTV